MWVRLDDGMAQHPKFVRSGPEAMALYVAGLCYCNRYRTQGLIPKLVVPSLLPGLSEQRARELALRLATNAARPSWVEVGDHFRVHDYEEYQPSRDEARGAAEDEDSRDGVTRYCNAVTRYGNASKRYGDAPLPGPLPPSRPVPKGERTNLSLDAAWEGERQAARRAANAERQRRFRRRNADRSDVTRYVRRYVTPRVTRYGDAETHADGCTSAPGLAAAAGSPSHPHGGSQRRGPGEALSPGAPPVLGGPARAASPGDRRAAIPWQERERRRRALNAARQRRFRQRQAARRAEALADAARAGSAGHAAAALADGDPGGRGGSAGSPLAAGASPLLSPGGGRPGVPPPAGRDRRADFAAWFTGYPRQEAEMAAQRVWLADPELPPLPVLLERLAVQRAAKPDPRFWLAPDRYLREKRWRDQPPAAPAPGTAKRSVWAQLRAMGSDEGRRQRLREISAAARFDPFAAKGPRD
jgi:hypothetical protein